MASPFAVSLPSPSRAPSEESAPFACSHAAAAGGRLGVGGALEPAKGGGLAERRDLLRRKRAADDGLGVLEADAMRGERLDLVKLGRHQNGMSSEISSAAAAGSAAGAAAGAADSIVLTVNQAE